MDIINKERAKQLENRILILSQNHDKHHSNCFPDSGDGVYQRYTKAREEFYQKHKAEDNYISDIFEREDAPIDWTESLEHNYLNKSGRIISKLRNELLAILYYNAVRNSGYTRKMISEVADINKYDQAGLGYNAIDTSPLFPKSDKEITE